MQNANIAEECAPRIRSPLFVVYSEHLNRYFDSPYSHGLYKI